MGVFIEIYIKYLGRPFGCNTYVTPLEKGNGLTLVSEFLSCFASVLCLINISVYNLFDTKGSICLLGH